MACVFPQGLDDLSFFRVIVPGPAGWAVMAAGRHPVEDRGGEVAGDDGLFLADDEGVFQDVFQLPDVARVVVVEQHLHGFVGDVGGAFFAGGAQAAHDVADEQGQVGRAVFEQGEFEVENVEAVEEVLPELAVGHQVVEAPVGGRDDPDVHLGDAAAP